MEIEFFGGNCFRIKTKQTTIVVDDNLESLGKKSILGEKTAAFFTSPSIVRPAKNMSYLTIDTPGEFEVGDVTVKGAQTRAHIDEEGKETATVFQFMHDGQSVSVLGHVHPDMSVATLELLVAPIFWCSQSVETAIRLILLELLLSLRKQSLQFLFRRNTRSRVFRTKCLLSHSKSSRR